MSGLCNRNTELLDSQIDIIRCLSREFAGDFKQVGKLESRLSDLERRVAELETYVEEVEAISEDHESVLDRQGGEISVLELQLGGQASVTSPATDSDTTQAKQAPTSAGANGTALDESSAQALSTSTVPLHFAK